MPEIRRILETIPELRDAKPVRNLGGGKVAESWLLDSPQGRLVLRVDRPLARDLALDRHCELLVLGAVCRAGLGPAVVFADPDKGVLITSYIDGEPWEASDFRLEERIEGLGRLFAKLHHLPPVGVPFDALGVAQAYARALPEGIAKGLLADISELSQQLASESSGSSICHRDAHAGNLVGNSRPMLIDWEYSSVGDPMFDLAVSSRFHDFDISQRRILLDACYGTSGPEQLQHLDAQIRLYDLLACLWQQVVDRN